MGSRVELFAAIRRDARVEGLSIRELARRHRVGRTTVRQALSGAQPPPRKTPVRTSPRLGPFKFAIDAMLVADLSAPKKQRHTARRVHARLIEEYDATEVSYSSVRDYHSRGGSGSDRHADEQARLNVHRVVSLTQYRLADPAAVSPDSPPIPRPLPSVDVYDRLLTRTPTATITTDHRQETGT